MNIASSTLRFGEIASATEKANDGDALLDVLRGAFD